MQLMLIASLLVKARTFFVGKLGPIWFGSLGKSSNKPMGRRDALNREAEEE